MFTYQDKDAPEIWLNILKEITDFNVDESIKRDYASRLACTVIRVFSGEVTNLNTTISDNRRWDLPYFDKIIQLAYQISVKRGSYLDKDLSQEQQDSKDNLIKMGKVASDAANEHILNISCEYKKSLVNLISNINPKKEYHTKIKNQLEELKNKLELFKEQVLFLNLNKLIALCVVYLRHELANIDLSDTEKKIYLINRINHLSKVFIAPVYKYINKALDFFDYTPLPDKVIQFNLNQLQEYGHIIYNDLTNPVYDRKIIYTEYPDPEIQFEIEKIKPPGQMKNETNLSRQIIRLELNTIKQNQLTLPRFILNTQSDESVEISCFSALITEFSCFMSKKITEDDSCETDDELFASSFQI